MARKDFMRAAAFLALAAGLTVSAWAQVTISGGFALSKMMAKSSDISGSIEGDVGMGGNIYFDYLLPVGIPVSLGLEVGVDSSSFTIGTDKDTVLAIPLLARVAYHFDLMPKLDLYAVGKLGMAFGAWWGDTRYALESINADLKVPISFAFGVDLGAAYYFTSNLGLFVEGGFDDYKLSATASGTGWSSTIDVPFYRFLTFGLSTKF
jgi:hypothetical protein